MKSRKFLFLCVLDVRNYLLCKPINYLEAKGNSLALSMCMLRKSELLILDELCAGLLYVAVSEIENGVFSKNIFTQNFRVDGKNCNLAAKF